MGQRSARHRTGQRQQPNPQKNPTNNPDNENQNGTQSSKYSIYPSAELIQSICYQEYRHSLDAYAKIYDKVNIALAFSGVILLVIISNFDYTIIKRLYNAKIIELICFGFSLISAFCIIWAVILLLSLLKPIDLLMFDSCAVRKNELYRYPTENASVWLIDKCTRATSDILEVYKERQSRFNQAITRIIIALVSYAIAIIIQKGI